VLVFFGATRSTVRAGDEAQTPDEESPPVTGILGPSGIDLKSGDGRYRLHLWFRGQLRFSTPFNADPRSPEDFQAPAKNSFDVQRIRIKLEGHAYRPWLNYSFEYDFKSRLLDVQLTLSRFPWLQFRAGQWKVNYNRERVDSSGKQQLADRSIVNREFTVDRQPGFMLFGRLLPGSHADSWYYLGLFNGNGANASNDDSRMMWLARYQWNFLGRDLPFSQGDVKIRDKPAGSLAFAAVGNRSPYTRFSTEGGGELDGFEAGTAGRYDLRQYLQELAFQYRGFSVQQELHYKDITDNSTGLETSLRGGYAQAGLFPWALTRRFPRPLELAVRWAFVDPDRSVPEDGRRELTFGANWFFSGHDNKLTADVSRLELDQGAATTLRDYRLRVQWDISF
jgi:hypothetical protein